ncbi:MAG: tandem-95 repeat protein, partial [Aestuariibacter sp.]|nr:tandem-95 repeat protein [Aestuariibacter sp.]
AVAAVNDAPVADDDAFTTSEDTTSGAIDLVGGDSDVDGDTLSVLSINGTVLTPGTAQAIAVTNGTVNVSAGGVVTFSPDGDYNGAISFDYVVTDGALSDTGTVNGTVTAVNDGPVAADDTGAATEDTTLNVTAVAGLLSNDTDTEGDTLAITTFTIAGIGGTHTAGDTVAIAGIGSLTINADGSYSFVPVADYNGAVPVATYTVSDGNGGTDTADLTIAVAAVNDAPVADDDAFTTSEDTTSGAIDLVGGDSDVDGDTLSVLSI